MRRVYLPLLMLLVSCLALLVAPTSLCNAQHRGSISGRVFDSESKPAFQMEVRVMKAEIVEANPEAIFAEDRSFSYVDQIGSYHLKYLAPGRYILAVNADYRLPYPVTYYPGIKDVAHTTIITVEQNQEIRNIDVLLDRPSLTRRVIEGIVVRGDGSPANARVNLVVAKYPWTAPYSSDTDEKGRFSLYGYEGIKYLVKIADYSKDKKLVAEPVEVSPKVGMKPVRVVLRSP
jgi:hypothetical protein